MKAPFLKFEHCDIGPLGQSILRDFSWSVLPGETWVITGPNGSGKSALASAISGDLPITPRATNATYHNSYTAKTEVLSFDRQQAAILNEFRNDESDFVEGGADKGTTALKFILGPNFGQTPGREFFELSEKLGITQLLDRGIKYLSTGEIRKVLLCRDLLKSPDLLILDEIAEGLDSHTRQVVAERLNAMLDAGSPAIIIISDRYQSIPRQASHVLCLENGHSVFCGPIREFEQSPTYFKHFGPHTTPDFQADLESLWDAGTQPEINLIEMKNVTVAWDGRQVLDNFNWVLRPREHSLVRGPNGCGKTTLLKLITGDNPQVYANQVTILGQRRGSGESIWDIKAKLGYVSYQFHLDYCYHGSASLEETLISGFQDSIGLYEKPSHWQILKAGHWLEILGLAAKRDWAFTQLSYGEQRAALVARAVIKSPQILILDEPCLGLDTEQRRRVLDIADYIGSHTGCTLIYITHDPEEVLRCTKRVLDFYPNPESEKANQNGYLPPRFIGEWRVI